MKGHRHRVAVKADYVQALGMATWCFASLEWQVVWCCEKIKPGVIHKIVDEEMTAGKIAKCFIDLARNMKPSNDRTRLRELAAKFADLVQVRNSILHGKPCTGPSGESRLSADVVLEIPNLEEAADQFSYFGSQLNAEFYGFLANYTTVP